MAGLGPRSHLAFHRALLAQRLSGQREAVMNALPNLLDVGNQLLIALCTGWQQRRVALPGRMQAVTAGGDLQDLADRLDPEAVTMLIDKCL